MTSLGPSIEKPGILSKCGSFASLVCRTFESILIYCILLFLAVTSLCTLFVTVYFQEYTYYTFLFSYATAPMVIVAIAIVIFATSSRLFQKCLDQCKKSHLSAYLVVYAVVFGCFWIALAHVWPDWDSLDIEATAKAIGTTNSGLFTTGSYISRFPFQIPFVLVIKVYQWVFGDGSYTAFELTNVFANAITLFIIVKLTDLLFHDDSVTKLSALLCFLFVPLILFCTFEYANFISLPFCLSGLFFQLKYFQENRPVFVFASALSIGIGVWLKSSMLLILVAMIVVWILRTGRTKKAANVVAAMLLVFVYIGGNTITSKYAEYRLGMDTSQALPKTAWIAMGLQTECLGWYNGYIWHWPAESYDINLIKKEASEDIAESLSAFSADIPATLEFFSSKYCSEWCMPDYECFLSSNWNHSSGIEVMSERPMSKVLHSMYYGVLHDFIFNVQDVYQTLLLTFALVYAIANRKESLDNNAALLACAGTALFYLFWEAKATYIMHAYLLLIPYAAWGLYAATQRLRKAFYEKRTTS